MPSLISIAEEILRNAKQIDEHLATQKQPSPSFDHDALVDLPPQVELARDALIDSTHTLKQLAQGPSRSTFDIMISVYFDCRSAKMRLLILTSVVGRHSLTSCCLRV